MLLTMGNAERTEPLTLIGPKGLERVVGALRVIAPELPFSLRFIELTETRQQLKMGPYTIDAYRVNHNVVCYGYTILIPRKGRFDVERARAQEIPQRFWKHLQMGETVMDGDRVLTPDMVLGAARRGLKVSYCTDTRPVPVIAEYAKDAQPEVLVTLIQTIVERIYIVDKDDERYCHIFIKGCSGEDYTGFFQTAGYIEDNSTSVCDSEQYSIFNIYTDFVGIFPFL